MLRPYPPPEIHECLSRVPAYPWGQLNAPDDVDPESLRVQVSKQIMKRVFSSFPCNGAKFRFFAVIRTHEIRVTYE